MKTHSRRSRKTLVITLSIIGTVVLLGVVGFLVWKNFLAPQQQPATTQSEINAEDLPLVIPPKVASDDTLGSGLVVEYPDDWTNIHTGAVDPLSTTEYQLDQNVITSPSGEVQVLMTVEKNTQIGGLCSNSYIKLKYLATDKMPTFSDARFTAYVVYYPNSGLYQYHIGAQKNTDAINGVTLESNSACNFMYSEYIDRTSSLEGAPNVRALLAIRFPAVGEGNNLRSGFTEAQVIERLTGEEYDQAKKIVQSLKVRTE